MNKLICLEGLIGAGKSTLGLFLQEQLVQYNTRYFPEYVNNALLEYYLEDIKNRAFTFQLIMLHQRFNIYRLAMEHVQKGGLAIVDRSFCGDYAFALMQKENGCFSSNEWDIYMKVVQEQQQLLHQDYPTTMIPHAIIYLQCDMDIIMSRIKQRNRAGENIYTIQYLTQLQEAYKQSLHYYNIIGLPFVVWDNNASLTLDSITKLQHLLQQIDLKEDNK